MGFKFKQHVEDLHKRIDEQETIITNLRNEVADFRNLLEKQGAATMVMDRELQEVRAFLRDRLNFEPNTQQQ